MIKSRWKVPLFYFAITFLPFRIKISPFCTAPFLGTPSTEGTETPSRVYTRPSCGASGPPSFTCTRATPS